MVIKYSSLKKEAKMNKIMRKKINNQKYNKKLLITFKWINCPIQPKIKTFG